MSERASSIFVIVVLSVFLAIGFVVDALDRGFVAAWVSWQFWSAVLTVIWMFAAGVEALYKGIRKARDQKAEAAGGGNG
jgi:hypothetical protein